MPSHPLWPPYPSAMASVNWNALEDSVLDGLFAAEGMEVDVGERYELQETLGKGGQGTVYAAFDRQFNRQVAVKVAHSANASRLLLAEAALLARLSHPAIPSVYDSGTGADGRAYMVMELVDGQPLYRLLRESSSLSHLARLRTVRAVAGAVAHAHQRGILHRDCKPTNIMIRTDGEPVLIDWGLAATGDPRAICGTPSYAAPEQLSGQVADRRSDIYALGVLCYEVLSGKLPYARVVDDFEEFRRLRAGLGLIPLRKVCPRLSAAYQGVIDRAMAAQPAGRYRRCEDLCDALDALIAGDGQSSGGRFGVGAASLVVGALGLGFAAGWSMQPEPAARQAPFGQPVIEQHAQDEGGPQWGVAEVSVPDERLFIDTVIDAPPQEAPILVRDKRTSGAEMVTTSKQHKLQAVTPAEALPVEGTQPSLAPVGVETEIPSLSVLLELPDLEKLLQEIDEPGARPE